MIDAMAPESSPPEDQVRQAARLARLHLDEEQVRRLAPQFERILSAFGELDRLSLPEPLAAETSAPAALRPDTPRAEAFDTELLLEQAPERIDRFFGVPKTVSRDP